GRCRARPAPSSGLLRPAAGAEARAGEERNSALRTADGPRGAARGRSREQLVEVVQPLLDPDDLGRLLVDEVLAEAVLPVHLENKAAEIADPLLAQTQERATLAPQLSRRRQRPPPRSRRPRVV